MSEAEKTVLVVDDEPRYVEAYRRWLEGRHEVRVAGNGDEALERADDTVDVVLLDRRMPGMTGPEVLGEIRDRGLDCVVIMVSSVAPDIDIVDHGFDDYLVKPVDEETLHAAIEEWLAVRGDEQCREYRAVQSKCDLLETHSDRRDLDESDAYQSLERRLETLREQFEPGDDCPPTPS